MRFAGVNVGTVSNIKIINDTAILVDMSIDKEIIGLMRKNAVATIDTDGLVGSMIVNIIPGEEGSEIPVEPGDTIRSRSQPNTLEMLSTLNTTNENVAILSRDLLEITRSIKEGEGVMGKLLTDKEMASNLEKSIVNLERSSRVASQTINKFNKMFADVDLDESVAGVLLKDTVAAQNITEIIKSLQQSSEEINSIAFNLNEFSRNLSEGEGALQQLTQDKELANDLDAAIKNVEKAGDNFNDIMKAIKRSFLFRGDFRRMERRKQMQSEEN